MESELEPSISETMMKIQFWNRFQPTITTSLTPIYIQWCHSRTATTQICETEIQGGKICFRRPEITCPVCSGLSTYKVGRLEARVVLIKSYQKTGIEISSDQMDNLEKLPLPVRSDGMGRCHVCHFTRARGQWQSVSPSFWWWWWWWCCTPSMVYNGHLKF